MPLPGFDRLWRVGVEECGKNREASVWEEESRLAFPLLAAIGGPRAILSPAPAQWVNHSPGLLPPPPHPHMGPCCDLYSLLPALRRCNGMCRSCGWLSRRFPRRAFLRATDSRADRRSSSWREDHDRTSVARRQAWGSTGRREGGRRWRGG